VRVITASQLIKLTNLSPAYIMECCLTGKIHNAELRGHQWLIPIRSLSLFKTDDKDLFQKAMDVSYEINNMLTVQEFATVNWISIQTVRRGIKKGLYPGTFMLGREWMIPGQLKYRKEDQGKYRKSMRSVDGLLDTDDIANRLGMSRSGVRKFIRSNAERLGAYKNERNEWRIPNSITLENRIA